MSAASLRAKVSAPNVLLHARFWRLDFHSSARILPGRPAAAGTTAWLDEDENAVRVSDPMRAFPELGIAPAAAAAALRTGSAQSIRGESRFFDGGGALLSPAQTLEENLGAAVMDRAPQRRALPTVREADAPPHGLGGPGGADDARMW
jgi:hypothetical protein